MNFPALSVIIPSFQQASFLMQALESLALQTFKDFEVVIMDGGSTDGTDEIVKGFPKLCIRYYSAPDKGIYDAMNKGIVQSRGMFLYFMGCDDRLSTPKVLSAIFDNKNNLKYDFIYGNVVFTQKNTLYDGKFNRLKLMSKNICHQAIFVKRSVFDRIGNFDLRYKYLADWVFNMACFNSSWLKKRYLPLTIALYNDGGSSANHPDENFISDKLMLDLKYFPYITRLIYYKRELLYRLFLGG